MKAISKSAIAPINTPTNELCNASDLLNDACAIASFVTVSLDRENPDVEGSMSLTERYGFHLIMHDMMDRINRANGMLDQVRNGMEGACHD